MTISELLTDESKWTTEVYARDAAGRPVSAVDPTACRWCLTGAMIRCYTDPDQADAAEAKLLAAWARWEPRAHEQNPTASTLTGWNDAFGRTFEDVKALVEEAGV